MTEKYLGRIAQQVVRKQKEETDPNYQEKDLACLHTRLEEFFKKRPPQDADDLTDPETVIECKIPFGEKQEIAINLTKTKLGPWGRYSSFEINPQSLSFTYRISQELSSLYIGKIESKHGLTINDGSSRIFVPSGHRGLDDEEIKDLAELLEDLEDPDTKWTSKFIQKKQDDLDELYKLESKSDAEDDSDDE